MGAKAFEQCAGFLRIPKANNPLDNSAVHRESYHNCGTNGKGFAMHRRGAYQKQRTKGQNKAGEVCNANCWYAYAERHNAGTRETGKRPTLSHSGI